jgi:hypothetical protein
MNQFVTDKLYRKGNAMFAKFSELRSICRFIYCDLASHKKAEYNGGIGMKGRMTHVLKNVCHVSVMFIAILLVVSCRKESREIVLTDTAEIKRIEAFERISTQKAQSSDKEHSSEIKRAEAQMTAAELKIAEANAQAAKARLMEQESRLEQDKLDRDKEIADKKKALEDEVAALAASKDTVSIFLADLRSRMGKLEIRQEEIPRELKRVRSDAEYLRSALFSYRKGVVTNIVYLSNSDGNVFGTTESVKAVTYNPEDFVKTIKADGKIMRIMANYNAEICSFEMDKVVEDLAYENKRLTTSWDMLKKGVTTYVNNRNKANTGTSSTSFELKATLDKVEQRILQVRNQINDLTTKARSKKTDDELNALKIQLGNDGAYPTGLYGERNRMKQMIELSGNTESQAKASSSGIEASFSLHEKEIKDEYNANVRRAFDSVERTVLTAVTERQVILERELVSAKDDYMAIQRILDARIQGLISENDMANLHVKFTNAVSASLSADADRLLKVK